MNFDMKNWKDGAAVGGTLAVLMITHTTIMAVFGGLMQKWENAKREVEMRKYLEAMQEQAEAAKQEAPVEDVTFETENDYAEAA